MNKTQLVEAIALDANITKVDARKAVDALIRVTVHRPSARESASRSPDWGPSPYNTRQRARAAIPARVRP